MKTYKNTLGKKAIIILGLTICCLLCGHANYAEAASAKRKAIKAYGEIISSRKKLKKYIPYVEWNKWTLQYCGYSIVYIGKDNVPELLIRTIDELYILKYSKGKIVKDPYGGFFSQRGIKCGYYKKKGIFWVESWLHDEKSILYYKLKNKQNVLIGYKSKKGTRNYSYKIDNKTVSKSEFNRAITKRVGKTKSITINNFKKLPASKKRK